MTQDHPPNDIRPMLEDLFDALLTLRAEVDQRDRLMRTSFDQKMDAVQSQLIHTERKLEAITDGAGAKIERHAREAVMPVAAEYGRAVESFSIKLRKIEKTVWLWSGAAATVLILAIAGLWWTLNGYKHDLDEAKAQYARFDQANTVLRAYSASDAIVCGELLCVRTNPKGPLQGNKQQYRPAMPRSSE